MTSRTAIIGAGLTGLSCARVLRRAGHYVELFEADHIIGGRMATMRIGPVRYDHGAQYITSHSSIFQDFISELVTSGYAARWSPGIPSEEPDSASGLARWFVGVPGMSSVVRPLAEGLKIHTGRVVHTLTRKQEGWHIWFDNQTSVGPFDAVAVCVPAPQAQLLLGPLDELSDHISRVRMAPCWSLMVRLDERSLPEADVYSDMSDVISWVARNSTKPGRNTRGETIVVQASSSWSRETEDADPVVVAEEIWGELSYVFNLPPVRPSQMNTHLWRYGLVEQALGKNFVYSKAARVGVAGDWCLGRIAEHAYESGHGLGRAIASSVD
jgi:renalase